MKIATQQLFRENASFCDCLTYTLPTNILNFTWGTCRADTKGDREESFTCKLIHTNCAKKKNRGGMRSGLQLVVIAYWTLVRTSIRVILSSHFPYVSSARRVSNSPAKIKKNNNNKTKTDCSAEMVRHG